VSEIGSICVIKEAKTYAVGSVGKDTPKLWNMAVASVTPTL
jgi:hypothetical protein